MGNQKEVRRVEKREGEERGERGRKRGERKSKRGKARAGSERGREASGDKVDTLDASTYANRQRFIDLTPSQTLTLPETHTYKRLKIVDMPSMKLNYTMHSHTGSEYEI